MGLTHEASRLNGTSVLILPVGVVGDLHSVWCRVVVAWHRVRSELFGRHTRGHPLRVELHLHDDCLLAGHGCGRHRDRVGTVRDPLSVEMDATSLLATVGDGPPVFKSTCNAHGGELDGAAADLGVGSHVLVHDAQGDIVVNLSDFQIECFVPSGRLATILNSLCAHLVQVVLDDHIWVHAEVVSSANISIQSGLDHGQSEAS